MHGNSLVRFYCILYSSTLWPWSWILIFTHVLFLSYEVFAVRFLLSADTISGSGVSSMYFSCVFIFLLSLEHIISVWDVVEVDNQAVINADILIFHNPTLSIYCVLVIYHFLVLLYFLRPCSNLLSCDGYPSFLLFGDRRVKVKYFKW